METAMAPSIPHYEIGDFEAMVNSFLSAPIDFGFDGLAVKNNSLSPASSSEQEDIAVQNILEELSQKGAQAKAAQLDQNNNQKQQPALSSDGSVHSSGSPSAQAAHGHSNFALTESALEPFLKADQPMFTFPSPHQGGVAMYAFNSGVTQSTADGTDSKAIKAEKNRSAQKRFRERQKDKLSTLQEQYDQMTEQLNRLTTENQRLHQRTDVLDKLVKVSEEHILSFDQNSKSVGSLELPNFKPPASHEMASACKPNVPRTQYDNEKEEMKKLSPEMFIYKWKEYLKHVSSLLLETEMNSGNSDSLDKISLLTCNVAWMCKHVSCLNQDTMNRVCCFNLEEGVPSMADDAHWLGVVKLLAFNEKQLADLRVVLELYQSGSRKIAVERQRIILEASSLGKTQQQSMYAWNDSSKSDEQVYEKLAKNLRRQHALFLMFKCFFFGQFVTLQQFAKAAVYSYPYFPDAIAIMTTAVHGTSSIPIAMLPSASEAGSV